MARAPRKEQAGRLAAITLDEASLGSSTDDVEHVTGVPAARFADFVGRTAQQFAAAHR